MKQKKKCLNPECDSSGDLRGLCLTCYQTAHNLVKHGKTTWAKLEANGKSLPSKKNTGGQRTVWLLTGKAHK